MNTTKQPHYKKTEKFNKETWEICVNDSNQANILSKQAIEILLSQITILSLQAREQVLVITRLRYH